MGACIANRSTNLSLCFLLLVYIVVYLFQLIEDIGLSILQVHSRSQVETMRHAHLSHLTEEVEPPLKNIVNNKVINNYDINYFQLWRENIIRFMFCRIRNEFLCIEQGIIFTTAIIIGSTRTISTKCPVTIQYRPISSTATKISFKR